MSVQHVPHAPAVVPAGAFLFAAYPGNLGMWYGALISHHS